MPQAVRIGDPISHTNAFPGLIAGAIAGAAIGAMIVATGGVGAIAVGACAGIGLGGVIGEFAAGFTTTTTGTIVSGSLNTTTDSRLAAKVGDRVVCAWHGGTQLIAEGSAIVGINGSPAARVGDRTTCGAQIAEGSGRTFIGGPARPVLPINPEVPIIAELLVGAVGIVGGVGEIALAEAGMRTVMATRLAVGLGTGLAGGTASSYVGGKLFGEGSRGQRQMALGGGLLSAGLGAGLARGHLDPFSYREIVSGPPDPEPVSTPSPPRMSLEEAVGKDTADWWIGVARAKAKANDFDASHMTDDQIGAVHGYTTSEGCEMINMALRGQAPMTPQIDALIGHASDGLRLMPSYEGTSLRGTNLPDDVLEKYQVGNTVSDKAFLSTSTDAPFKNSIEMEIKGTSGYKVSPISRYQDEAEILYPPDTKFRVLGRDDLDGTIKIKLEEIRN